MDKLTISKIVLFLTLVFIFNVLYVPDILHQYRVKATTITTKRESIGKIIWPAIIFCMEKPFKLSVLRNKIGEIPNRNIFTTNDQNVKYSKSLEDLYRKASYIKERDFKLNLNGKDDFLTVEELPTEDYGMCYSILHNTSSNSEYILFSITPNTNLMDNTEDNPKGVSIFITSENTRHFLINGLWPLKPLIVSKKFSPKYFLRAKVEEIEWKYYDGNPDCQRGCKMSQCLKWSDILESSTVFENHIKSLIQHCERSELHLHFKWTKVN